MEEWLSIVGHRFDSAPSIFPRLIPVGMLVGMASAAVWWRAATVVAGTAVAMTAFVLVTLDGALDRYVSGHDNLAVVDWRAEVLVDVVAVLAAVVLGALSVAMPALRLVRRRQWPGRAVGHRAHRRRAGAGHAAAAVVALRPGPGV